MRHTIGYIIESDDNVWIDYVHSDSIPYTQPEWVEGVNEFADISQVDPYDYNTPVFVRVGDGNEWDYYFKTLHVPQTLTNFKISVLIDGVEGNTSFVYSGYNSFIQTKRVGSEIYTTVTRNNKKVERSGNIRINYSSDTTCATTVYITQEACEISLNMVGCNVDDNGEESYIPINSKDFTYTFDTLTEKTDGWEQRLTFDMDIQGIHKKYFIKSIKQYVEVGDIDNTYTYIDGKYYQRQQKLVNDGFVTYYAEVPVIGNKAYRIKPYDKGLKTVIGTDKSFTITNYGRMFLEANAFYVVTLANYDDISDTCNITLYYAD